MKHNRMLAATAASTLTVGLLAACGHTSTPSASPKPDPFPRESQCQDIQRPADPHNVIGDNWVADDACNILNLNRPGAGVSQEQAEKIVYDARMRMFFGKRDIYMLAVEANKQAENPSGVTTDFAGIIAARHASITKEVNDARDALAGHAPEGYRILVLRGDVPSASPGLTPGK
ncbi:hypothetical protein [Mycobacteroides abscessus]|uniref:hypothetical protein n=1 Tax=Mycobacteroides abscessus TaxID=36809 RepID=UPI0019D31875|nr:hypothetical protein [Mycobacteroides abscessus]MBN7315092.1 hypothetical protein [Mycobacteroides abscessus subsp. abscessus]